MPYQRMTMRIFAIGFCLVQAFGVGYATNSEPIPIYMDEMLNAGRRVYDKQSIPTQLEGVPTIVNLSMYIEGLSSFRTQTMDFQLDVYFQQFWKDSRLAHNESKRVLIRDKSILDKIWHPDVYFANARIAEFHEVTQPNFLVWIEPDGSILYDTRISMIVMCMMNLAKWPLDEQRCHLRVLSYAYAIDQVQISWNEVESITRNPNIAMSDMHIVDLKPGLCDGNYSTGVWSCVTAEFYVKREITHHVMQSYVPTTLIVVISWFSFWLDVEAVPARVSLAITTLLTLSTQANAARMALPEVSYMKAIDVWMGTCMMFVFGVMIEFTIVNYAQRQGLAALAGKDSSDEKKKKKKDEDPDVKNRRTSLKRARTWLGRKFRTGVESRQLIEQNAEECPISEAARMRAATVPGDEIAATICAYSNYDAESTVDANSLISCGSIKKLKRKQTNENGRQNPLLIMGGPVKAIIQDDRWREREAERLANWAKVESGNVTAPDLPINAPTANSTTNTTSSNIWAKVLAKSSVDTTSTGGGGVGPARNDSTKSKDGKKAPMVDRWSSILKQVQKNKKIAARHEAKKIDQRSRWAFPLSFLCFNISYWTYYLYIA